MWIFRVFFASWRSPGRKCEASCVRLGLAQDWSTEGCLKRENNESMWAGKRKGIGSPDAPLRFQSFLENWLSCGLMSCSVPPLFRSFVLFISEMKSKALIETNLTFVLLTARDSPYLSLCTDQNWTRLLKWRYNFVWNGNDALMILGFLVIPESYHGILCLGGCSVWLLNSFSVEQSVLQSWHWLSGQPRRINHHSIVQE